MPGCQRVVIIYRRSRAEMPAFKEEVEGALEEGVELQLLTAPLRIVATNGKVVGVECMRMELAEPDESGRRRPVPVEGSQFMIELDTLLVAVGEQPDTLFLGRGHAIEVSTRDKTIVCQETLVTSLPGVFAGGDAVTGPDTVLEAMAAGKLAAEMIEKHIRGEPLVREFGLLRPPTYVPPVPVPQDEMEAAQRALIQCISADQRRTTFAEVDRTLSEDEAVREARRCVRCDLQTQDAQRQMAHWEKGKATGGSHRD
jgi:NADPH-dependent glutamate synthase beta subunit-like oxidoreductase